MAFPVVLDCDPGHDDAVALLLAIASEAIELSAVTTVAGNQTLEKTTRNACQLLELAGADIPVAKGANQPLVRELEIADHVHGDSGLGGASLPKTTKVPVDEAAPQFIADTVTKAAEPVTIISTGPLTNIALCLASYPEVAESISRIVWMGGSMQSGNVTPVAEFNSYVDPEAAHRVFAGPVPVTMVGLEVTRAAKLTGSDRDRYRNLDTPVGDVVSDLLQYSLSFHQQELGWDGAPMHDACAVGAVVDETLVGTERMNVAIELTGQYTRGMTVCDRLDVTDRPTTSDVGVSIQAEAFRQLLFDAIASFES